jgi:hypothetical protein
LKKKAPETQSPALLWRKKPWKLSRRHFFLKGVKKNSVAGISFLKELKKTQSPAQFCVKLHRRTPATAQICGEMR